MVNPLEPVQGIKWILSERNRNFPSTILIKILHDSFPKVMSSTCYSYRTVCE